MHQNRASPLAIFHRSLGCRRNGINFARFNRRENRHSLAVFKFDRKDIARAWP